MPEPPRATVQAAPTTPPQPCVVGSLVPALALPDAQGQLVRLRAFRQRRPVIVARVHGIACATCADWLAQLSAASEEFRALDAAILLVATQPPPAEPHQPAAATYPIWLADPHGEAAAMLLPSASPTHVAVAAIDRYNVCLAHWTAAESDALPTPATLLAELAHADQADCACTLPAWPG